VNNHRTPIIPYRPLFYGSNEQFDYPAICAFAALGFFLDTDTFWIDRKTLPVASCCEINETGALTSAKPYFEWHYQPRDITFDCAVDEFSELFESILAEQTKGQRVILPLSGGLDSRTQAAALKRIGAAVTGYSYSFEGGIDETAFARKIAETQGFPFHCWRVKPGYLWDVIDNLARINECYSEFTHPRQMAFHERYHRLGDVFSLGHWGDVLFDDMGVEDDLPLDDQVQVLLKKVKKKGGLELGNALWKAWGLEGNFQDYLFERVSELLSAIDIRNSANARIRAFKSMYWAPRWTSVNLSIFESTRPITVPYYDNRMCEFVCTVPERHLAGRKIQIEYLKRYAPKLAKITWQDHRPFNLFNYQWNKIPWNLPSRAVDTLKRSVSPTQYIQRNWELQFLGEENNVQLQARLFDEPKLSEWIPKSVTQDFYRKFKQEDPVFFSHSVSVLLTLSLFCKQFRK
jgi:rhodanese-related sulfurtransferase